MHRKFIALVASAALVITGVSTAPARAGDDDVAKWVAGIAALTIIGVAVADNKKKKRKRRAAAIYTHPNTHSYTPQHQPKHSHGYGHQPKPRIIGGEGLGYNYGHSQGHTPRPQNHGNNHGYNQGYNHGYGTGHLHPKPRKPHAVQPVVRPKPNYHPRMRPPLPAECKVTRHLHGNKIRGLSRRCLKRYNVDVKSLPKKCAMKFRDHRSGKRRAIFTRRCLRQSGYRIARVGY